MSHLKTTWALIDIWKASETSHSKSSLSKLQYQYLPELLVNVYSYIVWWRKTCLAVGYMEGRFSQIQSHLWLDLRKDAFHAHNSKTHFSPSNDSCIHWLTIQASIGAESCLGYFCCGLFLRLVRHPRVLGSPSNGSISPCQADTWL